MIPQLPVLLAAPFEVRPKHVCRLTGRVFEEMEWRFVYSFTLFLLLPGTGASFFNPFKITSYYSPTESADATELSPCPVNSSLHADVLNELVGLHY